MKLVLRNWAMVESKSWSRNTNMTVTDGWNKGSSMSSSWNWGMPFSVSWSLGLI